MQLTELLALAGEDTVKTAYLRVMFLYSRSSVRKSRSPKAVLNQEYALLSIENAKGSKEKLNAKKEISTREPMSPRIRTREKVCEGSFIVEA